jgi:hypothetical protein
MVANYPVPLGGVVEVHSVDRDRPMRLRFFRIQRLGWRDVLVHTTWDHVAPEAYEFNTTLLLRVSFSDVVLPWQYMFFHPVGWYVCEVFYVFFM